MTWPYLIAYVAYLTSIVAMPLIAIHAFEVHCDGTGVMCMILMVAAAMSGAPRRDR